MLKVLTASTLVALASADGHIVATPFALADGGTVDKTGGGTGAPLSFNALKTDAAKHEPFVEFTAARGVRIGVRGTDASTVTLHPQAHGTHWIEFVYLKDQDGNTLCEHQFTADEDAAGPVYACPDALGADVTTVTAFEYCNLHGLWEGPTYTVANEVAAAALEARATQTDTVGPDYFFISPVIGAPIKHQPAVEVAGNGFSISVLGTDGEGLHPHAFPGHYIEGVFARDQHDVVVAYQELGDNVETAQSTVFTVAAEATSLRPYEFCNLHGLWVGETVATVADGPDCTAAMHATEADAVACSTDGKAHAMGDQWGAGATHTPDEEHEHGPDHDHGSGDEEPDAATTAAAWAFAVVAAVATAFW